MTVDPGPYLFAGVCLVGIGTMYRAFRLWLHEYHAISHQLDALRHDLEALSQKTRSQLLQHSEELENRVWIAGAVAQLQATVEKLRGERNVR